MVYSPNMVGNLYTIPQAAEYFKVTRQYIWRLVSQKRMKAERIGQIWLIREKDLLDYEWQPNGRPVKPKANGTKQGKRKARNESQVRG